MNLIIVEDGEAVGRIGDEGGYEWRYEGEHDALSRVFADLEAAETYDATSGPGGETHEQRAEASATEKAERAAAAAESRSSVEIEPAPPSAAEKALDMLEELL